MFADVVGEGEDADAERDDASRGGVVVDRARRVLCLEGVV